MPIIDMHAHVNPVRFQEAVRDGGEWYGLRADVTRPGFNLSIEERLAAMDRDGIDMQLLTPAATFYQYDNDLTTTVKIARACNDEVATMVRAHPDRFLALGTLAMQDVTAAVMELQRITLDLGLRGAMISDHVGRKTYDTPDFLPLFKAAQDLDAILFFHQGDDTCVAPRTRRFRLDNAVGNLTERTLAFSSLVFGGVLDKCPRLTPLLAHGGGYVPYGVPRLDKIAGAFEGGYPAGPLEPPFGLGDGEQLLPRAPSEYLRRFYYDCCTYSGPVLRFLIDAVGSDRVVLGTDYPAPMFLIDSVRWINGLDCLTAEEKTAILSENASRLLRLKEDAPAVTVGND